MVKIYNKSITILTNKEKDFTYTLGVEIGNLAHGAQKRWSVVSAIDIPNVADEIFLAFQDYALPYYEKYSLMKNVFELLSSNNPAAWIHCPLNASRFKRVLGLAILLGYSNLVPKIIKDSIAFLQQENDFGLQDYIKFSSKFCAGSQAPAWEPKLASSSLQGNRKPELP